MGNLPLHPLIVHLPLALAVLLPPLIAVILWSERRRGLPTTRLWQLAALAAVLLTLSAFVSVRTGGVEKERVEAVVPERAIGQHEERAEVFQWVTLAPLALVVGAALAKRDTVRRYAGAGALIVSLVVAGLAISVGESGGRLVYEHNAGSAYRSADASAVAHERHEEAGEREH